MKNIILTGLLLASTITFTSCIGGGGGGGSSSSSSKQLGAGGFTVTSGPTGAGTSCFNHSAGTLGNTDCTAIGGSHSSSTVSTCNGVNGGGDMCDYGTPVTTCKIGSVNFSLQVAYSLETRDSCTMSGGEVVTVCSGVAEGDCSSAGGTWESKTVNTCTGYDVEIESNCLLAGGEYRPDARIIQGNLGDANLYGGTKIINGDNRFIVDNLTDDGSDPTIFSMTGSMEIYGNPSSTTHWSSSFSMTPKSKFYDDDYGYIYFNASSPVSSNMNGVDIDNDGSVDVYSGFNTGTLLID